MSGLHFAGVSADPSRPKGLLGVQISLIILPTIHCKMYMKVVFLMTSSKPDLNHAGQK